MTLKDYVLANVKPEDYYAKRFPQWKPNVRSNIKCVFHSDKQPSLALCLHHGGAKCHASTCGKSIGNIVHFESARHEIDEKIAARRIYSEFVRPIVSAKLVAGFRDSLSENGLKLLKIRKEMGLNGSSIKKFQLGLDQETDRITIPIYDEFGHCVNIRFYRLPSERRKDEIKIYNLKGYGHNTLFPQQSICDYTLDKPVYICAGEKDTMLAIQCGLNAACATAGEGSFDADWLGFFSSRSVRLMFDNDAGGMSASKSNKDKLATIAKSVEVITLPFSQKRPDYKDFTDWILKEKHEISELRTIRKPKTKSREIPKRFNLNSTNRNGSRPVVDPVSDDAIKLPKYADDQLHEIAEISSQSRLLNLRIRTQGIVAARSANTFSIPWRFKVKPKFRQPFDYDLPIGRELLRFVRSSDSAILLFMQEKLGGPVEYVRPIEFITVTEVEIIPIAAVNRDVPYVVQRCFYVGESIKDNVPYYFEIIPTAEIRSQETVGIITKYEPLSQSLDKFTLTLPLQRAFVKQFQPSRGQNVWDKLVELTNELSKNHTHIYHRLDWHLVALLSWASPIGWRMPGDDSDQRGWINALALGDTETGKSAVCKTLQRILNCGIFVNAENCTYVGLVGGAIKVGNGQLMLRWGRIPLCDKQLVILEELSGLSVEEISNMSDVRSSGIARLDKGGINSQTNSRTRLVCLSNARSQHRNLSSYMYGVKAIQELIGHGEDIARFDLITTLIDREVDVNTINSEHFATVAKTDIKLLQQLIHYIWSLTPSDIKFSTSAYHECLEQTKKLSTEYHASIPIFKGGSGRYKLARIAAAIACLQFSYSEGKIVVQRSHILATVRLLRSIYDKPSFGYKEFSRKEFDRENLKEVEKAKITLESKIISKATRKSVLESLIHMGKFTAEEFRAVAGCMSLYADQIIGAFFRSRIIRKGEYPREWEITLPGKAWMEKQIK